MKELQEGGLLNSTMIKANAESALKMVFDTTLMLTSLYVSQKVNAIKPQVAEFDVIFVKDGKAISVDDMIGEVLADKVVYVFGEDVTKVYDLVDVAQQELEQWDIELVYKNKYHA